MAATTIRHRTAGARPTVFIASSAEMLDVAEELCRALDGVCEAEVWTSDASRPGEYVLEALIHRVETTDFAVVVLGADDVTTSRGVEQLAPRDNLLIEFGGFAFGIGRERAIA
ncbi:MAG TPA: TIR domain-containing protein, partial [Micromonosporaceae bacterium]|nr:TIR domain-containing protein [Micromonosporaceae bacterium]